MCKVSQSMPPPFFKPPQKRGAEGRTTEALQMYFGNSKASTVEMNEAYVDNEAYVCKRVIRKRKYGGGEQKKEGVG